RIELLLGDLHGARHCAARTWGRTIKLPRWLFPSLHPAGDSAAATLRAREQVPIPHQVRGVHAADFAVPLDPLGELFLEAGTRIFPRDLDKGRPDADDVVLRDHPDELAVVDNGEAADLPLRHELRGLHDP